MTTTTFKSVGGTSAPTEAPAAQPAAKPAKGKAPQAAVRKAAQKPDTIIIAGEGTIPVHIDGAMRRLPKGKAIEVSDEELAFLKRNKVEFA